MLASTLAYLYKEEKSQWRDESINLIYTTTRIAYAGTDMFENFLNKLLNEPQKAYMHKEEEYEDYVSTTKVFIYLFYALST